MRFSRRDYNGRIVDTENKIPEDEPCFLLRGQDSLAPRLLLMWAMELRLAGGDPALAREAEEFSQEMIRWQSTHKKKTPDMYSDTFGRELILNKVKELLKTGSSAYVGDISKLLREAYNTDEDQLVILMRSDINSMFKLIDFDSINIKCFSDYQDPIAISKARLILYVEGNKFKVLKEYI